MRDFSVITAALIKLLEGYIDSSKDIKVTTPFSVSSQPGDTLQEGMSLYLYHISEDVHYKNLPDPHSSDLSNKFLPIGLNLYYQLTAHFKPDNDPSSAVEKEQNLMNFAMRAFHYHPIINSKTVVNNIVLFDNSGLEDLKKTNASLKIDLQNIDPSQAISFWANSNSGPRLAAYYKVSVVLLEPEEKPKKAGRVLTYDIGTFIGSAPRITDISNVLELSIPDKKLSQKIEIRPAQVSPASGTNKDNNPEENTAQLKVIGSSDEDVALYIKCGNWAKAVIVESNWWISSVNSDGFKITIRENTKYDMTGKKIIPGICSAFVKVIRKVKQPDGTTRTVEHNSNEIPFAIAPRIDPIKDLGAAKIVNIKGYLFNDKDISFDDVLIYFANVKLKRLPDPPIPPPTPPPLPTPGIAEFIVTNLNTIVIHLPDVDANGNAFMSGKFYPIRIFVNGVESSPKWIEYPKI